MLTIAKCYLKCIHSQPHNAINSIIPNTKANCIRCIKPEVIFPHQINPHECTWSINAFSISKYFRMRQENHVKSISLRRTENFPPSNKYAAYSIIMIPHQHSVFFSPPSFHVCFAVDFLMVETAHNHWRWLHVCVWILEAFSLLLLSTWFLLVGVVEVEKFRGKHSAMLENCQEKYLRRTGENNYFSYFHIESQTIVHCS